MSHRIIYDNIHVCGMKSLSDDTLHAEVSQILTLDNENTRDKIHKEKFLQYIKIKHTRDKLMLPCNLFN